MQDRGSVLIWDKGQKDIAMRTTDFIQERPPGGEEDVEPSSNNHQRRLPCICQGEEQYVNDPLEKKKKNANEFLEI